MIHLYFLHRIISAYEDKVLTSNYGFKKKLKITYKDSSFNSFVHMSMFELNFLMLLKSLE